RKPEGDLLKIEIVKDTQGTLPQWGLPGKFPGGAPPLEAEEEEAPRGEADFERIRKTVFRRACAACHGTHGQGAEEDGRRRRTIHDPTFLALISDQALRRLVITGRPD